MIELGDQAEAFRIAELYAHRGDAEQAFKWLRIGQQYTVQMGWRIAGRRPVWLLEY